MAKRHLTKCGRVKHLHRDAQELIANAQRYVISDTNTCSDAARELVLAAQVTGEFMGKSEDCPDSYPLINDGSEILERLAQSLAKKCVRAGTDPSSRESFEDRERREYAAMGGLGRLASLGAKGQYPGSEGAWYSGSGFPTLSRGEVIAASKRLKAEGEKLPAVGRCIRLSDGTRELCHDAKGYYWINRHGRHGLRGLGAMKSMTYGTMPSDDEMYDAYNRLEITCFDFKNDPRVGNGCLRVFELVPALKKAIREWRSGDEEAGQWASDVLSVLGFEWI